ncbi:MAG: hypothetical protein ABEJ72_09210 [Candidatus Aenigmatarchaeota archaeon]
MEREQSEEMKQHELIEELIEVIEEKKSILKDLLEANETAIRAEETLSEYDNEFGRNALERVESAHKAISEEGQDLNAYEEEHQREEKIIQQLQGEENTVEEVQSKLESLLEEYKDKF